MVCVRTDLLSSTRAIIDGGKHNRAKLFSLIAVQDSDQA